MKHLVETIGAAIGEHVFTAASVAVAHPSLPAGWSGAWGTTPPKPVMRDTQFDLASVTKVFTATLYARLVDRGWLAFDTPVAQYLPGVDSRILAWHLLNHSAGLIAYQEFFKEAPGDRGRLAQAWMRKQIIALKPEVAPGTRVLYSDPSFMLLGWMIEEASNRSLSQAMEEFLLNPIGVVASYGTRDPNVAATEDCPWRKHVIRGEVHDENAWALGGVAGHAGLFATADQVLLFAEKLMHGHLLSAPALTALWRAHEPGGTRTLGWDLASQTGSSVGSARDSLFGGYAVGHLGYTGTSLWLSPVTKAAVVLLTNRVHPTRANDAIRQWRPKIHEAIAKDLVHRNDG